jgi:hypothetical protein
MVTKTKNIKIKEFDAVKMMREIRTKINSEIKDFSFEELRKYMDAKLSDKKSLIGK